ncbi:MAG TPA: peptidoglycan-binding domain-containing protein [Micromonosporaceae bacterium]|jgi:Putative peptidoglycan binding domain
MGSAFLAPSLVQLRAETNATWPKRDKKSDGWIGDAAHQARKSDHNPDGRGCVHAIDVDRDGIDTRRLVLEAIRDPRTNYVIFERKIYSRSRGFKARAYTGSNPHMHHIHISILRTPAAETNVAAWLGKAVQVLAPSKPVVPPFPGRRLMFKTTPGFQRMHGSDVRTWQARMKTLGHQIEVDGFYGPQSEAVAEALQKAKKLAVDGIVGPNTWAASWA